LIDGGLDKALARPPRKQLLKAGIGQIVEGFTADVEGIDLALPAIAVGRVIAA
jgi:hypothetical protein